MGDTVVIKEGLYVRRIEDREICLKSLRDGADVLLFFEGCGGTSGDSVEDFER